MVEFTRDLVPGSALDLASGPGRNAQYLAKRGWMVTAIDGSPVAIDILRAQARERNLSIDARIADLEAENFRLPDESYDLILSCYYFQRSLIPQMKSALRPGGLILMIVLLADRDQPHGSPIRAYPGELRTFFDDWRFLHYSEGEPAVAELVAQKTS